MALLPKPMDSMVVGGFLVLPKLVSKEEWDGVTDYGDDAGGHHQCSNEPVGAPTEGSVSGRESGCASEGNDGTSQSCRILAANS